MSFEDFWAGVYRAAGLKSPGFIADAVPLDRAALEESLRRSTAWLTRGALDGFTAADFADLPEPERGKFTDLMAGLRRIVLDANAWSPDPAPSEAVEAGLPLFLEVIDALEFHRYADPEGYVLGKTLEYETRTAPLGGVEEMRFQGGNNYSGDPALYVWVILNAEVSDTDERFLAEAERVRTLLDPVARRLFPDRGPYLSFRSITEQAEPVDAV